MEDPPKTPVCNKARNNKVRDMKGTNPATPLDRTELAKMERCMSPIKQNRVENIHCSSGIKETLTYNQANMNQGPLESKPQNRPPFKGNDFKKEVWKPLTTT